MHPYPAPQGRNQKEGTERDRRCWCVCAADLALGRRNFLFGGWCAFVFYRGWGCRGVHRWLCCCVVALFFVPLPSSFLLLCFLRHLSILIPTRPILSKCISIIHARSFPSLSSILCLVYSIYHAVHSPPAIIHHPFIERR